MFNSHLTGQNRSQVSKITKTHYYRHVQHLFQVHATKVFL